MLLSRMPYETSSRRSKEITDSIMCYLAKDVHGTCTPLAEGFATVSLCQCKVCTQWAGTGPLGTRREEKDLPGMISQGAAVNVQETQAKNDLFHWVKWTIATTKTQLLGKTK